MNRKLTVVDRDDPRLPGLVSGALRRARIAEEWAPTVRQLATGELKPNLLHCCGSGCRPCVQEILRCAVVVTRACHDPREAQALEAASDPSVRGRVRRLAGRLRRRLRSSEA